MARTIPGENPNCAKDKHQYIRVGPVTLCKHCRHVLRLRIDAPYTTKSKRRRLGLIKRGK